MAAGLERLIARRGAMTDYMTGEIARVIRALPKRAPGSAGERLAAEDMAETLRRDCGCERVTVERFPEHPGAFYGYMFISYGLAILAAAAWHLTSWLTLVLVTASIALSTLEFIMYKRAVDPLFPRRWGTNVTAVKACAGPVRRRVFFNGHTDASWEWPVNYALGGVAFEGHLVISTAGVFYYFALALAAALGGPAAGLTRAALWGLLFVPFWVGMFFLWDRRRIVDGANDNLSGCYMGIAVLKAIRDAGIALEHTEVGVILTGSEEVGLRGAKAWCEAHRDDFRDVPTYIFTFDTIHDPRHLMANDRDLNGTLRADRAMADLFVDAAREQGIPCRRGWVPPFGGATDSAAFTQGGFRSLGVTGLNHKLEDYYHTRRDTFDNLNAEGLANCFAVAVRALERIDRGELDG